MTYYVTVRFDNKDSADTFVRGIERQDGGDVLNALADGDATVIDQGGGPIISNVNTAPVTGMLAQIGQVRGEVIDHSTVVRRRT